MSDFGHSGGSSGGSGGAPTGAAGGDLSGTYPNPTVATQNGHTIVTTSDTGSVTSAMLAGSIAPSKVTGTAVTAADTGTVTSAMIADGTIVNADVATAAAIAVTKLAAGADTQVLTTSGTAVGWAAAAGGAPSGTAGGDLSGTYPNPGVAKLNGTAAASYALLASPTLTGTPAAPTPAFGDSTTKVATTAYVTAQAPKVVIRTGDATARNSGNTGTTLTNDDTLLWAIGASDVWTFRCLLLVNAANATMDAKFGWSVPTGATMWWGGESPSNSGNVNGWGALVTSGTVVAASGAGNSISVGTLAGTAAVAFTGIVWGDGVHAGNVTLQWAQNTSDAGNLLLSAKSLIIAQRAV